MELTPLELLKIAKNIEENGFLFYSNLVKKSQIDKVKKLFERLAQDEQQHKVDFDHIASQFINVEKEEEIYLESDDLESYLSTMLNSAVFKQLNDPERILKSIKNEEEAIKLAIDGEKSTIEYYLKLKTIFPDKKNIQIIDKIIKEEENHLNTLIDLLNTI